MLVSSAQASPSIRLRASLTPEQLGKGTTIGYSVRVTAADGRLPPPTTIIEVSYPAHIGIISSGLGTSDCSLSTLRSLGIEGCPRDSLMGYGNATAALGIEEGEVIEEYATVTTWMAPFAHGHLALLIDAEGYTPLSAEYIFPATVEEAGPPYGGDLRTLVPAIRPFPEAPLASVIDLNLTIGPKGVTYYKNHHGQYLAYKPLGLTLPATCPHHGFQFAATITFLDGTHTTANTTVPCPRHHPSR